MRLSRAVRTTGVVAAAGLLTLALGFAEKTTPKSAAKPVQQVTGAANAARSALVAKAHALDSRGRPDMAIQLWQQILLSDPNNAEALTGIARDLKLTGSEKASEALDKLRRINPNDPNIAKIQALPTTRGESEQLKQAGALARQGKLDDAMRVYRQLYGSNPPDGDVALAYYQTLYGTATGKTEALAGMRALCNRNPGDTHCAIELGTMLTYDQRTRTEGIHLLQGHTKDGQAQAALRQALLWDASNPNSANQLKAYIKDHPQDAEMAGHLKDNQAKLASMHSGVARNPKEQAAFAALNAHRLDEAQQRFADLLDENPKNGRAAAGMGFLRMQQKNFAAAITYLSQAQENGYKDRSVVSALSTSRFWYTMSEASVAFDDNRFDEASARFKAALVMNPRSPEALNGLAGLLLKQQQYAASAEVFELLVRVAPSNVDGWRGLFNCYARLQQNQRAMATQARFPAGVRNQLHRDPDYLRTLASLYQLEGKTGEAQRVLAEALDLPFPNDGTLKTDTKLQYAGLLADAKRYQQAATLFNEVLEADPSNKGAWMGLISAHHEQNQDQQAIAEIEKMPAPAYEASLSDAGFLSMLAAIYQQANQYEVAQGLLERSLKIQIAAGGTPSVDLRLQLAAIYLLRNNTELAYGIYRQVLTDNPERADAWKGLVSILQATSRNTEALQEVAQIPAPVRQKLEADIEFVQLEASLYAATGDTRHALETMARVQQHYAKLKTNPPAAIETQNAWLLYNTGADRQLYPALMRLGGRNDLSAAQKEKVQDLWASWSVRRAATALENGNLRRATDILDAANQAFPENLSVRKAVAGGYARIGRAKDALNLFKTVPMQDATSGDFQGAVGAALAAGDKAMAEAWLRQALERYPHDPAVLTLAARYEQSRGDSERAADYYRASLAAMPSVSAADRLAHTLVYPEQDERARKAVTAADLQKLLDPSYEPFPRTNHLAPLPAYGDDPYEGSAPVKTRGRAARHIAAALPAAEPEESAAQLPAAEDSNPAITQIPAAQPATNTMLHQQSADDSTVVFRSAVHIVSPRLLLRTVAYGEPQAAGAGIPIQISPAHSLASDAWKGLIFSLTQGKHNDEALAELAKIPADVRSQLESDIEFVQGIAGLYLAMSDVPHAMAYLNRVEDFYLLHHTAAPASLEVQHAWLLYNMANDSALYSVITRLDQRSDLAPAQRVEVENIWASWAVRRANTAMENGNILRGVQILQAASQDYPDNLTVRRAVAGAYARVGRGQDAMTLYKTIPMDNASVGDYQGAVSAALVAPDLPQAEAWLRVALGQYPNDPTILALAARFEQARGNNERATDYWRAAIAAMPPGSSIKSLDSLVPFPAGVYRAPSAGDTKRLLDPRMDPPAATSPLPTYPRSQRLAPASAPYSQGGQPLGQQRGSSASSAYSTFSGSVSPAAQNEYSSLPSARAIPAATAQTYAAPGVRLIEQAAFSGPVFFPAVHKTVKKKQSESSNTSAVDPSTNGVEPISPAFGPDAAAAVGFGPEQANQPAAGVVAPSASRNPRLANSATATGLRITAQPMGPLAAEALAQFANQIDSQLTAGSASGIHAAPALAPVVVANRPQPTSDPKPAAQRLESVQYTPSAQEAATGAFSATRQDGSAVPAKPAAVQPQAVQPQVVQQQAVQQLDRSVPVQKARKHKKQNYNVPTLAETRPLPAARPSQPVAPLPGEPSAQYYSSQADLPQAPAPTSGVGLSDEELSQRNLPPLRGPWVRVQRDGHKISPREEAEMQLQAIESGYSSWLGGSGLLNYRTGQLGYDHLAALEAPFEATVAGGYHVRLSIIARPVFLDSGQADGTAQMGVIVSTTSGSSNTVIATPIGTLTGTDATIPAQQNAVGLGGEVQLAFPHFAVAAGSTPYGFLVQTITGRALWKPANGPVTFSFNRDSVKDSQLAYAGLRDPAGTSLGVEGQIWGGVVANAGNLQYAKGDEQSGFYFGAGGQYITGYMVPNNTRIDGSGGAYWRVLAEPEFGNLNIGVNFFAMHYNKNQDAFTHGMGGYFSPQGYFLANAPLAWTGHYGTRWHYNINGGLGVQAFQENKTKLWPLAADTSLETSENNPYLPDKTIVGMNYDLHSQLAYQIGSHWFVGGQFSANNTRDYSAASIGFSVRYLFREQPSTVTTPTGLFPSEGMRPFIVP